MSHTQKCVITIIILKKKKFTTNKIIKTITKIKIISITTSILINT